MKEFFQNIFATRRVAFYLNLAGLTLAFVIFYILMAEVKWIHDYDRCYRDYDRIYQVRREMDGGNNIRDILSAVYNLTTTEEIAVYSPAIEYATAFIPGSTPVLLYDAEHPEKTAISIEIMKVTSDFAHVFGLDILEGEAASLVGEHVLLPLSFVKKLFGEQESYVGRRVSLDAKGEKSAPVGAVYRDLPENATLQNCFYLTFSPEEYERGRKDVHSMNYMMFVRLHENASPEGLFDNLEMTTDWSFQPHENFAAIAKMAEFSDSTAGRQLAAVPFSEICFSTKIFDFGGNCSRYTYSLYMVLAGLILLIASINYMNFAMAKVPYQIKEINVRKILGERSRTLRLRMAGETLLLGGLAFALSVFILWVMVQNGLMDSYMQCDLALSANLPVLGGLFLIALLVPLLASVYPTWYTTSRKPALVINGNFALSAHGRSLRHVLIGLQFGISLLVIMVLLLMNAQHYYIRHAPVGYARDSILYVKPVSNKYSKELRIRLKEHPAVVGISVCDNPIGTSDAASIWGRKTNRGENVSFRAYRVGADFMKVMGIPIIEGRDFRIDDKNGKIIFNESARAAFGLTTEDLEQNDYIGVFPDIQTCSFRTEIIPTGFSFSRGNLDYYILRIDSPKNFNEVGTYVKNIVQELYGTTDGLEIFTADEALDKTYEEENKQTELLSIGSVASLLISLIGVFGLVLFETRARRKEIGIRKVFGATTKGILAMFNAQYLRILIVCFVVAAPVALQLYNNWIESFAYRTPVHWWLFGVAFLIVSAVVCLTVTVQSWRAAREKPVDTIMK